MLQKIQFSPSYQLDKATYKKLEKIAGCFFEHDDLSIYFRKIVRNQSTIRNLYLFSVERVGIKGIFYLEECEVKRFLNIGGDVFSSLYIEYLLSRSLNKHGVVFQKVIKNEEITDAPLISANVQANNKLLSIYCDIASLEVDFDYMYYKKNNLQGSLVLSSELKIFEVYLTADEVDNLTSEDLVLL